MIKSKLSKYELLWFKKILEREQKDITDISPDALFINNVISKLTDAIKSNKEVNLEEYQMPVNLYVRITANIYNGNYKDIQEEVRKIEESEKSKS